MSGSSRLASTCTLEIVSSALMGNGPDLADDFRLLLLAGCLALEEEGMGDFNIDGLLALQMDLCQRIRGDYHSKDTQFWDTIWVFLEKEANDLNILQVRFQVFSLVKPLCEFSCRIVRMVVYAPSPNAGVEDV
jgi:hypothetical protein